MDEDDDEIGPWIRISGTEYGDPEGFKRIQSVLHERLTAIGERYNLEWGSPGRPGQAREIALIQRVLERPPQILTTGRNIYRLTADEMLRVLRAAWLADDVPAPDASTDEGTLYDFASCVLSTLNVELV